MLLSSTHADTHKKEIYIYILDNKKNKQIAKAALKRVDENAI